MSQYYITASESPISVTRINEVLVNHPSSTAFAGSTVVNNISIANNTNSKISSLANQSYKYLFSQNITSLDKRPIKFSDFRNNLFFASVVNVIGETPSQYGNQNDGSITIIPFGGTGGNFKIKIYVPTVETYIDGYTTGARTKDYRNCGKGNKDCNNHPWSYPKIPIYKTRIVDVTVAETECLAGNSLTKIVDTGTYHVRIEQIDATGELSVIRSYDYAVSVGWRGDPQVGVFTLAQRLSGDNSGWHQSRRILAGIVTTPQEASLGVVPYYHLR